MGYRSMQQFRSGETTLSLDLRTEVPEDNDSRHVGSNKDRSDQQLKVLEPLGITAIEADQE